MVWHTLNSYYLYIRQLKKLLLCYWPMVCNHSPIWDKTATRKAVWLILTNVFFTFLEVLWKLILCTDHQGFCTNDLNILLRTRNALLYILELEDLNSSTCMAFFHKRLCQFRGAQIFIHGQWLLQEQVFWELHSFFLFFFFW